MDLNLGYRFRPTDFERLVLLLKFIAKGDLGDHCRYIKTDVDVYGEKEPWEIYDQGLPCGGGEGDASTSCPRFFISVLNMKSDTSKTRISREVGKGIWKQQDKANPILRYGGKIIGHKKSLFYLPKDSEDQKPEELDGQWVMKEYELSKVILGKFSEDRRKYVLCVIKKKPHSIKKTTASSNSETTSTSTETTKSDNDNNTALASGDQEVTSTTNRELQSSDFQESHDQAYVESVVGESEGTSTQQYPVNSNMEEQQLTAEEREHNLFDEPHQVKPLSVVEPQTTFTSRDQQNAA